jgi:hypothetical protein
LKKKPSFPLWEILFVVKHPLHGFIYLIYLGLTPKSNCRVNGGPAILLLFGFVDTAREHSGAR